MNTSESRKFKPGDIVRVVRGESKNWILDGAMRVLGYRSSVAIDLETFDGGNAAKGEYLPYCLDFDCELDVFLNAAHKAVRDA